MSGMERRIYSTLAGVMYGDAYGMPTEGMSPGQIQTICPDGIQRFLPSINDKISTRRYEAGSVTDDTLHTLLLIDAICASGGKPDGEQYMQYLSRWYQEDPRADEVIGPSTLSAIRAFEKGKKNVSADYAVTNGCMMKIAPVGLLYEGKQTILNAVTELCRYTHNANVALSSAAVVAYLISSFTRERGGLKDMDNLIFEMEEYSRGTGFDMPSASIVRRVELGNEILKQKEEPADFMREVYELIGTGIYCTETLPAAVTIIKYCQADIRKTAQMCAGMGGDTDTIASIACAICGALGSCPSDEEILFMENQNALSIREYVQKIAALL
ncbi:MAG: ADP-ribosylglycohydrolase family protein [Lachnospiraceae bacterium]|nr:ADP-ribosylglycohydrolase family protein [Lachnospiraceae bacterium]